MFEIQSKRNIRISASAMPLDELKMTILQELRVEHEISIDAFVEYYR
jgi:hypothetical protein